MVSLQRNRLNGLFRASRVRIPGEQGFPLHDHDFGEVFWLDEGACIHGINGERSQLKEGDFCFIRPWDQHQFVGVSRQPFFVNNLCFQWHLVEELAERYFPPESDVYGVRLPMPRSGTLRPGQLEWFRVAFSSLIDAPMSRFYVERYLMNLFGELVPLPRENPLVGPSAPTWMQRAWHEIQQPEHLRGGVPVFCSLCGRSPEHVSREFHKITGQTLSQSITALRMKYAATLLNGTGREIIEISYECGFESLSHFYHCFRRVYGTSPMAYRKRSQQRMYPEVV